ncbi:MAG: NAD-dependent epimerase/dehydratase family protein, partial [Myxococcota bacterium]
MSTVLVTGGAGFIGSHVVDLLLQLGHRVLVLDDFSTGKASNLPSAHDRLRVVEGDVADPLALRPALKDWDAVERIVHLAAQTSVVHSIEHPQFDLRVNARGTVNVMEYARESGTRKVVFASSAAVYGDVSEVPVSESAATVPLSPYGVDKLASEHYLRYYAIVHGIETTPLRFFNVYGARQDPTSPYSGVISIFLDRASTGRTIRV